MIKLSDIKDFGIDLVRKTKGILPEAKGGTGQSKIAKVAKTNDYNDLDNKPTISAPDLSAYQLKTEKNASNGYIGANSVGGLDPAKITQTSLYRLVTDALMSAWSGKQDSLGFTPENSANKNIANGYFGLDTNVRIDSIEKLEPYQKYYGKL